VRSSPRLPTRIVPSGLGRGAPVAALHLAGTLSNTAERAGAILHVRCWSSSAPITGGGAVRRLPLTVSFRATRVELLPGVGHTPMMEDPQTTGKLVLDFAAVAEHTA
jgi:hypothetical protein